jgi:hypothetical protein
MNYCLQKKIFFRKIPAGIGRQLNDGFENNEESEFFIADKNIFILY